MASLNLFTQQPTNQHNAYNNIDYGSQQYSTQQYIQQQQQLQQQQQQQLQYQAQQTNGQLGNSQHSQQNQYIHSDMPLNVHDLQSEIASPPKSKKTHNRKGSSKKKSNQRSDEKQSNNDLQRHSSNQFQSHTAQQISRLQFAIPQGISSTASPKRVTNSANNNNNHIMANPLPLDQQSSNQLQQSNTMTTQMMMPINHLKNNSNFYQTTASKYSQDSNSKQSNNTNNAYSMGGGVGAVPISNFIQNQAQLPTNKNHLTKKQMIHHPPTHQGTSHLYALNNNSNNSNNNNNNNNQNNHSSLQSQTGANQNNTSQSHQQIPNMVLQMSSHNTAHQNIAGFYNQITPKNNKRNFQDSLQNTIQSSGGSGLNIKTTCSNGTIGSGLSLQNSKTKPIFNHNSNSGTVTKGHNSNNINDNISQSTQVTSQRLAAQQQHPQKTNVLLQNIKIQRAQHDNNSLGSAQGLASTNIVLDSSGSAVQNNFSSNGGTFQEMYSTGDGCQSKQQQFISTAPFNGVDLKMIMPLTTKNNPASGIDNQFATSIFSKNNQYLLSTTNKKNFKIINNMITEHNMKQSYDAGDKSAQHSIRQDSTKRSQKTQERIQNMIQQNLESPHNNILPRNNEGTQKQSLSPKQKSLKQQLLINQQQWLLKNQQQNVIDQQQFQHQNQQQYQRDQKSSSRSKNIMKKNFSLTQNNLKIKSPYNQQLSSNQSNLLKFFHQNSKFQQSSAQNMNSVNAGYKNSFSNYLSTLNQTHQDQHIMQGGFQNQKHQQSNNPITQVAHLINPQLDFYTQNGHIMINNQLSYDGSANTNGQQLGDANHQYYYQQLSNHKRKNQSTDRRHLNSNNSQQRGVLANSASRNAPSLTKRDTPNSQVSRKQTLNTAVQSQANGLQGSNRKLNKKRAQSQVKTSSMNMNMNMQSSLDNANNNNNNNNEEQILQYTHQILEQQMRINQLESQVQIQQQEYEEAVQKPQTKDQSIDLQTSFEKQRTNKINIKVKSYRNDLDLFIDKLNQNSTQEKDKLLEEFQSFLLNMTEDAYILDPDCPSMRELIRECFKVYNDQLKTLQSQKQTQQNISPSAYEILKQDYDKLQKENQFNKEKLKLAQEYSQQQRKTKDTLEKKLEEREQVILLMQETFEKELENLYTENDIKKFARELNVLYEQNQELHKMNKRMKYELRMAQEREHQFIKIIKKSPELVRMLDMEDSSILENKVPQHKPKPQEVVLVSSKQVPVNKLDLDKVAEIQKQQVQGTLAPLEESKVIDKKEMRDQVKDMIIMDQDSEDEHSLIQHEEMNRKNNGNHMHGGNDIMHNKQQQQLYNDDDDNDEDEDDNITRNFHDEYNSEDDDEDEALYGLENQEINQILQINDQQQQEQYIYKTQNQQINGKNSQQKQQQQQYEDSAKNRPPERKMRNLHQQQDNDDDDEDDLDRL